LRHARFDAIIAPKKPAKSGHDKNSISGMANEGKK